MKLAASLATLSICSGILRVQFNGDGRAVRVLYDPAKLEISRILSSLERLDPDPRVISSVLMDNNPPKELSDGKNQDLR